MLHQQDSHFYPKKKCELIYFWKTLEMEPFLLIYFEQIPSFCIEIQTPVFFVKTQNKTSPNLGNYTDRVIFRNNSWNFTKPQKKLHQSCSWRSIQIERLLLGQNEDSAVIYYSGANWVRWRVLRFERCSAQIFTFYLCWRADSLCYVHDQRVCSFCIV